MNGEVPPCIMIPPDQRSMRDVKIGKMELQTRSLKIIVVSGVMFILLLPFFLLGLPLFLMSVIEVILMLICTGTLIYVAAAPYFTVIIPSDSHICDLRVAVARELHVSPLNLELGYSLSPLEDTEAVFYSNLQARFYYAIRDEQAKGVIASLYS